jgi:hypothetical protein
MPRDERGRNRKFKVARDTNRKKSNEEDLD